VLDELGAALWADPQLEDEVERPYPSAQRAGDLQLWDPGLRPLHGVLPYRRVSRAAHGLKANRGFIKLSQSRPKVKFSNRKVKEKDREYAAMLWRSAFRRADKTVLPRSAGKIYIKRRYRV
jgi:hypothetical protein